MPYTAPHILLTVQGDGYTLAETWQFGVRCRPTPVGGVLDLDALVNAMAVPTNVFVNDAALGTSNKMRLVSIKAAYVLETGLYPEDLLPAIYLYAPPVAGASAGTSIPQATIAVTMISDVPRGRASRGRFYLPPMTLAPAADGRLTVVQADAIAQKAKIWLNAIRATAQVDEILVMSKLGAGKTGVVKSVGVGRVVDTMRSRRRSLKEDRLPLLL